MKPFSTSGFCVIGRSHKIGLYKSFIFTVIARGNIFLAELHSLLHLVRFLQFKLHNVNLAIFFS